MCFVCFQFYSLSLYKNSIDEVGKVQGEAEVLYNPKVGSESFSETVPLFCDLHSSQLLFFPLDYISCIGKWVSLPLAPRGEAP